MTSQSEICMSVLTISIWTIPKDYPAWGHLWNLLRSLWQLMEKTRESPLDCKEIKSAHPKGNQSWIFIGRTDAEAVAPILWSPDVKNQLIGKNHDAGKDWRQEANGTTEDEMVGWHHRPNGPLGSSVCEISQARILKWVAISYYRGYPSPRNWTHVSCIGRQILYHWATGEARVNTWHSLILFFRDKHDSYLLLFP